MIVAHGLSVRSVGRLREYVLCACRGMWWWWWCAPEQCVVRTGGVEDAGRKGMEGGARSICARVSSDHDSLV
jgi:hypothetical protein